MRLLYYSFNIRYALTARLLALLLLVSSVAAACSSEKTSEEEIASPDSKDRASDTTGIKAVTNATATLEFLGNPFISNRSQSNSLSSYFDKIQDDFTLDADAIENIHRSSVTDTIYTIRFGNSVMEFYAPTQTGELLLQIADIRDTSISLRNNIRVGIDQKELMGKLRGQNLQVKQTQNEIIAGYQEGAPSLLHFYLKNGKVNRILYEGYVD